jgi:hypothetical protein
VRAEQTSVRTVDDEANAPVNFFGHAGGFARPEDRTVVAPNVDTLYSITHLDLAREPMVISHPSMGSRYFSFALLDPWTNIVGYIGSRTTGSTKGRFAIVWTGARKSAQRVPKGIEVIRVKHRRIWVIGRTLATDGSDVKNALELLDEYELAPASRVENPPKPPRGRPGTPRKFPVPEGMGFLDALAAGMKANPPPSRDRAIVKTLADAGIEAGGRPSRSIAAGPFRDGLIKGLADAKAQLPVESRSQVVQGALANGGWYTAPSAIGDYGRDYDLRAAIAIVGLGANTPEEAIYPTALTDSTGALLNGANRYRVTFAPGQQPPNDAFWSLTMYDIDGYLVDNDQDRYAVGDSHPPLRKRADGSIVIAIQHDRPTEPDVNWLPAPSALFRMSLRVYEPKPSVLNGSWTLPPVERVP